MAVLPEEFGPRSLLLFSHRHPIQMLETNSVKPRDGGLTYTAWIQESRSIWEEKKVTFKKKEKKKKEGTEREDLPENAAGFIEYHSKHIIK